MRFLEATFHQGSKNRQDRRVPHAHHDIGYHVSGKLFFLVAALDNDMTVTDRYQHYWTFMLCRQGMTVLVQLINRN